MPRHHRPSQREQELREALSLRIAEDDGPAVAQLVRDVPALLSLRHAPRGGTALFEAVADRRPDAVRALVAAGALIHEEQGPFLESIVDPATPWTQALLTSSPDPLALEILGLLVESPVASVDGLRACRTDLYARAGQGGAAAEVLYALYWRVCQRLNDAPEPPPRPEPSARRTGPCAPLYLSVVAEEVLDRAATFRVGPDRLPADAFNQAAPTVAWAAYWYRDHAHCAPHACECEASIGRPRYPRAFGGEGVILVAYADGRVGVYTLDHGRGEPPLDWGRIAAAHAAGCARLTPADLVALRAAAGGHAPRFPLMGGGERVPAAGAGAVWRAWEAGIARHGLPTATP